eukprot:jgi/Psemu1/304876/fgenesh1_kg.173_\
MLSHSVPASAHSTNRAIRILCLASCSSNTVGSVKKPLPKDPTPGILAARVRSFTKKHPAAASTPPPPLSLICACCTKLTAVSRTQ